MPARKLRQAIERFLEATSAMQDVLAELPFEGPVDDETYGLVVRRLWQMELAKADLMRHLGEWPGGGRDLNSGPL